MKRKPPHEEWFFRLIVVVFTLVAAGWMIWLLPEDEVNHGPSSSTENR